MEKKGEGNGKRGRGERKGRGERREERRERGVWTEGHRAIGDRAEKPRGDRLYPSL